ncbi:hypothetical protein SAMD00019534_018060 [Acytostelium subglobosum LB1]|uniref:hypothetical protein n=1 Tax=Acytostelium subglobosum LB1 TaxID=1410327 RepID=UPI000644F80E|nr:hypothetical protein SAMD00019534_018060 [Acytostelium subglobosum LB1]GAM18631.1 hypothetical protein SAMD00019534_018060 [Acytostelium subglobosum LB1]|eukprot:XP_012757851.1 hypothetical protein SAMD00019534_018060 [Acytostelium subglobosum LB1]
MSSSEDSNALNMSGIINQEDPDDIRISVDTPQMGSTMINPMASLSPTTSPSQSPVPNNMATSSDSMFVIEDDSSMPPTRINLKMPHFVTTSVDSVATIQKPTPVAVQPTSSSSTASVVEPTLEERLRETSIDVALEDATHGNPLRQTSTPLSNDVISVDNSSNSSSMPSGPGTVDVASGLAKTTDDAATQKPSTTSPHEHNLFLGKVIFSDFLKRHTCYDVIPISGKVVVLDTKLVVKSAFYALEENGIKSAPLWSSQLQEFTGMITVSDFIDILLFYYHKPKSDNIFQDMGIHRIETFWREINVERPKTLIYTEPETNLYESATLLLKYKIHRLPVVDKKETNSILHILTHSRILAFMMKSLPDLPTYLLSCTLGSLGIGTFEKVVTVHTETPLIKVLELLAEKKISAVPIIDDNGKVIDVYSKSDVTLMAKQGNLSPSDLDKPVHQVLTTFSKLWQRAEQIHTCTKNDKLGDVIEKSIKKRVHRLVCVDAAKKVEGILSLSDILNFLLNVS